MLFEIYGPVPEKLTGKRGGGMVVGAVIRHVDSCKDEKVVQ